MILTKQPAVERDLSYGRFFGSVLALMGDAARRFCVFTGCSLFEVYESGYFFRSASAWVMSRSPIGNRFSEKQDIVFFSHPLYLVNNIVILSKKVRRYLTARFLILIIGFSVLFLFLTTEFSSIPRPTVRINRQGPRQRRSGSRLRLFRACGKWRGRRRPWPWR